LPEGFKNMKEPPGNRISGIGADNPAVSDLVVPAV